MLALSIILVVVFLIWAFFVTTVILSMTYLGETLSLNVARKVHFRLIRNRFFQKEGFEQILFTSNLSGHLAYLGVIATVIFSLSLFSHLYLHIIVAVLIVSVIVILLVGDLLPRLFANRSPERALAFSLGISSFFVWICLPFSLPLFKFLAACHRHADLSEEIDPIGEMKETMVQILQSSGVKGRLGPGDKKLIESVIKFRDRIVREVMVPRVNLFSLPSDTTIQQAAHHFLAEGYSRIPVYHESVDNIIGILMFKDFLKVYMDAVEGKREDSFFRSSIESVTKAAFYTPETKKVSHLLQEFRTKQVHLAIVVDEYGGTEGVVTIEDILEEIVGEIADEYDLNEDMLYTAAPGGGWIVDARMSVLDAEDAFGIVVPKDGDYDTIGGYIFHRVGSIPPKGLKIHHEDFNLEILSSTDRSIEKVKITPHIEKNS